MSPARSASGSLVTHVVPLVLLAGVFGLLFASCPSTENGEEVDLGGMTQEEHDALFPITFGTHAEVTCAECHGTGESFSQFACTDCHAHDRKTTDAAHLGIVAGYVYRPTSCYACHPAGQAEGFDHEQYFPISAGTTHQDARCGECHLDARDRSVLGCTGCHTDAETTPRHTNVADYAWESASCYACHPKADVPIPVDHARFFPIGPGTRHQGIGCASCHTVAGDRTRFDCVSCHTHEKQKTDLTHTGVPGYAYSSPSCYQCHPQSNVEGLIDHSPFFPIGPGQKHAGIACSTCHTVPGDRKQFDCVSCHTHEKTVTDANHTGVPDYVYASPSCYACHPTSSVEGLVDHDPIFPISAGSHTGIACATCHTVPGDRKAVSCSNSTCHVSADTAAQHTQVGGYQYTAALCLRCHGDSQVHPVAQHLPFRINSGAKHFRESCLACHPAMRPDKSFAAAFGLAQLSCEQCHSKPKMDDTHSGEDGYEYKPQTCVSSGCHQDGSKP